MGSPEDSITDDDGLTAVASHLSDAPRHDYDASSAPPRYRAGIFLLGWRLARYFTAATGLASIPCRKISGWASRAESQIWILRGARFGYYAG